MSHGKRLNATTGCPIRRGRRFAGSRRTGVRLRSSCWRRAVKRTTTRGSATSEPPAGGSFAAFGRPFQIGIAVERVLEERQEPVGMLRFEPPRLLGLIDRGTQPVGELARIVLHV